ncbi:MAG: hypothetical protein HDR27_09315 [Lachnospiraceae bacterium]|nr:hypothetical protein [Lachnospiraceae bacterium]
MASIPVNSNLNAFNRMVNKAANVQGSQNAPYTNASYAKQEEALQGSFDMVMNRINLQAKPTADVQGGSQTVVRAQAVTKTQMTAGSRTLSSGAAAVNNAKQDTLNNAKVSDTDGKTASAAQNDKVSDAAAQNVAEGNETVGNSTENGMTDEQKAAVTEAGEKIVEEVAEKMDVTPEEVEAAMEVLGLSAIQLLDPENMKQLLIAISGNEDQLSIITDGELYGHLQNLLDTVSVNLDELQTELGLSEEELKALLEKAALAEKSSEVAEIPEELTAETEEPETAALEGMKDYAVTVHRDGDEVKVKVQVDDAGANQSVREEITQTSDVQEKHGAKSDNRDSFGENRGEGNMQDTFMMQTPVEQPSLSEVTANQQTMERFTSTEEIMNQITEYIKINLKSDVQEMELQLHPASLGTVNIQLAAKDGVITAQFTAQNETVKAAIESQLVQLRTQFEEQGIKVDAVEVIVANYRFEQSFSGKEENPGEGSKNGKKGPRRINLNDLSLEELPEDMEDSERIAAEMMASNGNTVDYTA